VLRVVVADDAVLLREGLIRLLTENGHQVVAAVGDGPSLVQAIEEHRPDAMAIEQVFTNKNLRTSIAVGRASGVALLAAAAAGLPVHEYTPTQVKSAVAGFGQADKRQVQRMVAQRLGLVEAPKPADAADALAVAICHLQAFRLAARMPG